jgi:hypothetical protein
MLLWLALALAADPPDAIAPPPPDHAEYARLSQELESLASRDAWAGAERTFQKMIATRVDLDFPDLLFGAHAARALGDMGAARDRLVAATSLREEREVIDWLWDLDRNFSRVTLRCDAGSGWRLEADAVPFNPDQQRAIAWAIAQIDATCTFAGLLPEGGYRFAERAFVVEPGVTGVDMDLRGLPPAKRAKRKAKSDASAE